VQGLGFAPGADGSCGRNRFIGPRRAEHYLYRKVAGAFAKPCAALIIWVEFKSGGIMKDSSVPQLERLLPELFSKNKKKLPPGVMCTPESGCGPAVAVDRTDTAAILTGLMPAPPELKERSREKPARHTGEMRADAGPESGE
jgi:hypothetical protein